jgi:hypothetical protein
VLKPVFSRFGGNVYISPSPNQLNHICPSQANPWILQDKIRGNVSCSYGIAIDGRILCSASYDCEIVIGARRREGIGASVIYEPNNDSRPYKIAETLLGPLGYTGQFGFDFIEQGGELYCLECNPRATSGIHLLEDQVDILSIISGKSAIPHRLASASNHVLLMYCLATLSIPLRNWRLLKWLRFQDVTFRWDDPLPFFVTNLLYLWFQINAKLRSTSGTDLFYEDLSYDMKSEAQH